jgi:hypothetical protein
MNADVGRKNGSILTWKADESLSEVKACLEKKKHCLCEQVWRRAADRQRSVAVL